MGALNGEEVEMREGRSRVAGEGVECLGGWISSLMCSVGREDTRFV